MCVCRRQSEVSVREWFLIDEVYLWDNGPSSRAGFRHCVRRRSMCAAVEMFSAQWHVVVQASCNLSWKILARSLPTHHVIPPCVCLRFRSSFVALCSSAFSQIGSPTLVSDWHILDVENWRQSLLEHVHEQF